MPFGQERLGGLWTRVNRLLGNSSFFMSINIFAIIIIIMIYINGEGDPCKLTSSICEVFFYSSVNGVFSYRNIGFIIERIGYLYHGNR